MKPNQLTDRAKNLEHQVGQYLNDQKAADFIANVAQTKGPGTWNVPLPAGITSRSFLEDGTELVTDVARVAVKPDGAVRTSFPFSSLFPTSS